MVWGTPLGFVQSLTLYCGSIGINYFQAKGVGHFLHLLLTDRATGSRVLGVSQDNRDVQASPVAGKKAKLIIAFLSGVFGRRYTFWRLSVLTTPEKCGRGISGREEPSSSTECRNLR